MRDGIVCSICKKPCHEPFISDSVDPAEKPVCDLCRTITVVVIK